MQNFIVRIDDEQANIHGRYELRLTPDITPERLRAALSEIVATVFAWEGEWRYELLRTLSFNENRVHRGRGQQ